MPDKMTRAIDIMLAFSVIGGLSFILLVEIANLYEFGTQEYYLHHPDYPEGYLFKRDVRNGFIQLTFWSILTTGLLIFAGYYRLKNNKKLFYRTALVTFILSAYLPVLTIKNGLATKGFIMALVILGFVGLTLTLIRRMEK